MIRNLFNSSATQLVLWNVFSAAASGYAVSILMRPVDGWGVVVLIGLAIFVCGLGFLASLKLNAMKCELREARAVRDLHLAGAEQAGKDKVRFLGMLSHEILTPIHTVVSTLGLIEQRGTVAVDDQAFIRLKEGIRVLRGRMADVVDFAKLSVGKLEIRVRPFGMTRLMVTLIDDYEAALEEKGLDLHWEQSPLCPSRLYADPTRIRQILENLLSNAIKYTERGGVTLCAELLDDATLKLEVSDSGVGLAESDLERVFEPFFRVGATAHMAVGSGLGLAVVRSLVDLMGGSIAIHSSNVGTRVTVTLPVALTPPANLRQETELSDA